MSEPLISSDIPPLAEVVDIKKRIEKLEAIVTSIDTAKLRLVTEFVENIGIWRCSKCKQNINNICTGWKLSKEFADKIVSIVGEGAVVLQDNVYRINISRLPFVGAICPIFVAKI